VSEFEPGQIIYPWAPRNADAVDAVLKPWAESRKLHILTQHGEAEVRFLPMVDDSGDTYDLVVGETNDAGELTVVAGLRNRTAKHVWHREREQFTFSQTVSLAALSEALDQALAAVLRWVGQAGHTRTSA
jgi:hypothetical protein